MNVWFLAATVLLLGIIPCGYTCLRGSVMNRILGLQLAGVLVVLVLLLIAEGYQHSAYFDVPLTLALLSFPSMLALTRFLERWL